MVNKKPRLQVVEQNYTLTIGRGVYGFQPLIGMLEIIEPLPPDFSNRLNVLEALIRICKAETEAKPLPDEFPVLPAALDAVTSPYVDNPSLLQVTFRQAIHGETFDQRLRIAQDVAPALVDFVVGRFDPLSQ